jgi:hypothetical protein
LVERCGELEESDSGADRLVPAIAMFWVVTGVCCSVVLSRIARFMSWVDSGKKVFLCLGSFCAGIVKEHYVVKAKCCGKTNKMSL